MMIYVNGQDIARLVLGSLRGGQWAHAPEVLAISPEEYLLGLENFFARHQIHRSDIDGFVLVSGPGSATALRTAHALVNSLALALNVSVTSVAKQVTAPDQHVSDELESYISREFALPAYSRDPNVTPTKRDALRRKSE